MTDSVRFSSTADVMRRAVELARRGLGCVEPNPAVGAVLVDDRLNLLGEGWHQQFGGPHAEVNAFADFERRHPEPDDRVQFAAQATLFVTLEPCCHTGRTPPCTEAILACGVRRVVIGIQDPSPHVNGDGLTRLRQSGIEVAVGLLDTEVRCLNAPFLKCVATGLPYVHAKWAMTLDGKIATKSGMSQWISNEKSRATVHRLRGRMDAIIVGAGTVRADDPRLTARPSGPRTATRIVVDSQAGLPLRSALVQTAGETPVLVAALDTAPSANVSALQTAGVDVLLLPGVPGQGCFQQAVQPDLRQLLTELGQRGMTNVLVEGGSRLLGSLFDLDLQERRHREAYGLVDEVHIFVAPKFVGDAGAMGPLGGVGIDLIPQECQVDAIQTETLDGDVYIHGPLVCRRPAGLT